MNFLQNKSVTFGKRHPLKMGLVMVSEEPMIGLYDDRSYEELFLPLNDAKLIAHYIRQLTPDLMPLHEAFMEAQAVKAAVEAERVAARAAWAASGVTLKRGDVVRTTRPIDLGRGAMIPVGSEAEVSDVANPACNRLTFKDAFEALGTRNQFCCDCADFELVTVYPTFKSPRFMVGDEVRLRFTNIDGPAYGVKGQLAKITEVRDRANHPTKRDADRFVVVLTNPTTTQRTNVAINADMLEMVTEAPRSTANPLPRIARVLDRAPEVGDVVRLKRHNHEGGAVYGEAGQFAKVIRVDETMINYKLIPSDGFTPATTTSVVFDRTPNVVVVELREPLAQTVTPAPVTPNDNGTDSNGTALRVGDIVRLISSNPRGTRYGFSGQLGTVVAFRSVTAANRGQTVGVRFRDAGGTWYQRRDNLTFINRTAVAEPAPVRSEPFAWPAPVIRTAVGRLEDGTELYEGDRVRVGRDNCEFSQIGDTGTVRNRGGYDDSMGCVESMVCVEIDAQFNRLNDWDQNNAYAFTGGMSLLDRAGGEVVTPAARPALAVGARVRVIYADAMPQFGTTGDEGRVLNIGNSSARVRFEPTAENPMNHIERRGGLPLEWLVALDRLEVIG